RARALPVVEGALDGVAVERAVEDADGSDAEVDARVDVDVAQRERVAGGRRAPVAAAVAVSLAREIELHEVGHHSLVEDTAPLTGEGIPMGCTCDVRAGGGGGQDKEQDLLHRDLLYAERLVPGPTIASAHR